MVTMTDIAVEKAKEVMAKDKKNYLRVGVQGGGCSGFQYHMELEDEKSDSDKEFDTNGVRIIIDPVSMRYVKNIEIDFIDNITGGGFSIKNPDATSTCGCGSSFDTK